MRLLCATETLREERSQHLVHLARKVDDGRFLAVAHTQGLVELAGARLARHAPHPPERLAPFREALAENRTRALALEATSDHLLSRLEEVGIPALALKGPGLSRRIHVDPGLRAAGDVDLLVPREDLRGAVACARALGYAAPSDRVGTNGLPPLHFSLTHAGGLPQLELHWRVHWIEESFSAGTLRRSEGTGPSRKAQAPDELAMLLLFLTRDGFMGLRLCADLAAWWDRFGGDLPPHVLEPMATEHPGLRVAWTAAALAAQGNVGLPGDRLLALPASHRRVALALRLGDWTLAGDPDQLRANVSLIDGLVTPRPGWRAFLWRALVPSRREAEQTTAGFAAKRLARYVLALWTIRRGGTQAPLPLI